MVHGLKTFVPIKKYTGLVPSTHMRAITQRDTAPKVPDTHKIYKYGHSECRPRS